MERTIGTANCITAKFVIPACLAGALALALPAIAADAQAQGGGKAVSERLVYRDLDLTTARGAHILLQRVGAAAQNLCAQHGPRLSAGESDEERRCRDQATARVVARLGSDLVTAEYARESRGSAGLEAQTVMAKAR